MLRQLVSASSGTLFKKTVAEAVYRRLPLRGRGLLIRLTKAITPKPEHLRTDCSVRKLCFGSEYGGWEVAVQHVSAKSVVYAFGIGTDASFDTALIDAYGLTVHAFDPTPQSIAWVRNSGLPAKFVLHEYGVANFDGEVSFNPPADPAHVSHTILERPETSERAVVVPVKRLSTIMTELGHQHIDILKMDIEGAEYAVIDDLIASNIRPTQLLVEFHDRFPGVGVDKTKAAIAALRGHGYGVFSVSATGEEYSFILKSTLSK